ncbi:uncharacterized protein LOC114931391 [Nylanderia fulva]|uniref:uncharacterized protein LOC114931391 n=1 Tax=Nylanderia fulva TaxID=613905 RepID=UPI0010FAFF86|nr:uncharacterized protein LOC114931391 [Nylanderia fulva]
MPRQTKKRSKILSDKMESNILDPVLTTKKKQHVDINKSEQNLVKNEDLFKKIALLEDKVQTSIAERLQYEKSIKNEEQKWQKILNMKTQEVKMFRIKMQKLRTLQMQEKKKMEHKIKILRQRIKEVKKNSQKNIEREISEICIANLTTQFKEVFEPLKQSGNKFDVEDVIAYFKINKNVIVKPRLN